VNETPQRVIVVAGALTQPHWVPPTELKSSLKQLSRFDLTSTASDLPASTTTLPRELAHDRWLRLQPWPRGVSVAPGAMSAVRRLAPLVDDLSGWLLEPVHFHVAQDHIVLVAGAARDLDVPDARQLAEAIMPLLDEASLKLTVLNPRLWLLTPQDKPLQLDCASSDAAAGRNIAGYLPGGSDARQYRRLLNEIQMTWHEHPVNLRREASGELPINSVWLSGPVAPAALSAYKTAVTEGRYQVDETLLAARLRDDQGAWLDALQALDAKMHEWLTAATPPAILLCGDTSARWLQRKGGRLPASRQRLADGIAAVASRWASLVPGRAGRRQPREAEARAASVDPLVRIFTETA
jgi:hypothetical protein